MVIPVQGTILQFLSTIESVFLPNLEVLFDLSSQVCHYFRFVVKAAAVTAAEAVHSCLEQI
jgi:hypothetical protein